MAADDRYVTEPPAVQRTPEDPDLARAEIEMTRARMSETIDEIEDALLRKKARIQDRLDVLAPVRENPLPSAAAALGAGLLLGLLTGGDDEDEVRYQARTRADADDYEDELRQAEERAATWETRARRLMRVAREQEEELESRPRMRGRDWDEEDYDDEELDEVSGIRNRVADGVTGFLGNMARDLFAPRPH